MSPDTRRLLVRLVAMGVLVVVLAVVVSWLLGAGQSTAPVLLPSSEDASEGASEDAVGDGVGETAAPRPRPPSPPPLTAVEVSAPSIEALWEPVRVSSASTRSGPLQLRVVPPMRLLARSGHVLELRAQGPALVYDHPKSRELSVVAPAPSHWSLEQREGFVLGLEHLLFRLGLAPDDVLLPGLWRAELLPLLSWVEPRPR